MFFLIGLAVAGLAYLIARLTIGFLRKYRKKKNSQIVVANLGDMIRQMPKKEQKKFTFDELEEIEDETIVAEYDESSDEVVQANFVGDKGMDNNIENALYNNDGMIIIED